VRPIFATLSMIVAGALAATTAIAGLDDRLPPSAYVDPVDQQIARTGHGVGNRPFPCARERMEHGIALVVSAPTERCVKMLPARRWRGLWINEFENSRFCPAPARSCTFRDRSERVWLNPDTLPSKRGKLYTLEFIGRRTIYKGPYGHMGASDHVITVDRLISARKLR
jgi:hypothetical protein